MFDTGTGPSSFFTMPTGFHFSVNIIVNGIPFLTDMHFQEVSGLEVDIPTEAFPEGGESRYTPQLPQVPKYSNLVLKRGLVTGSLLIHWMKMAIESYDFRPALVLVSLLNGKHIPKVAWSVTDAYPVKWNTAGFNAERSELAIETIELTYKYFKVYRL